MNPIQMLKISRSIATAMKEMHGKYEDNMNNKIYTGKDVLDAVSDMCEIIMKEFKRFN